MPFFAARHMACGSALAFCAPHGKIKPNPAQATAYKRVLANTFDKKEAYAMAHGPIVTAQMARSYRLRAQNLAAMLPTGALCEAAGACGLQNSPPGAQEDA